MTVWTDDELSASRAFPPRWLPYAMSLLLLLGGIVTAHAQQRPDTPPDEKQIERDLKARITKKQADAQAFYQHYLVARRALGPTNPTTQAYSKDASGAMEERNEAEFALCQLYLEQGRRSEATGRLLDLGRRGVKPAIALYNDLDYEDANQLYAESQQAALDGKESLAKSKEKASLDRLWRLHRSGYQRATDTLKALDKL